MEGFQPCKFGILKSLGRNSASLVPHRKVFVGISAIARLTRYRTISIFYTFFFLSIYTPASDWGTGERVGQLVLYVD